MDPTSCEMEQFQNQGNDFEGKVLDFSGEDLSPCICRQTSFSTEFVEATDTWYFYFQNLVIGCS